MPIHPRYRHAEPSRTKRLRAHTHPAHDRLDRAINARQPFASREAYGRFLRMQYAFHRDVDQLYCDEDLRSVVPDLAARRRLALVEADLTDLDAEPADDLAAVPSVSDRAAALGWLYVAEGSNLGAAFLLKEAARLGLSAEFGARHLGAPAEGRGARWRRFTEALDACALDPQEDARAEAGAAAAFAHAEALMHAAFAAGEALEPA